MLLSEAQRADEAMEDMHASREAFEQSCGDDGVSQVRPPCSQHTQHLLPDSPPLYPPLHIALLLHMNPHILLLSCT